MKLALGPSVKKHCHLSILKDLNDFLKKDLYIFLKGVLRLSLYYNYNEMRRYLYFKIWHSYNSMSRSDQIMYKDSKDTLWYVLIRLIEKNIFMYSKEFEQEHDWTFESNTLTFTIWPNNMDVLPMWRKHKREGFPKNWEILAIWSRVLTISY